MDYHCRLAPRSGYWLTPAKPNSRRHFKQGDMFPEVVDSSYGATFWLMNRSEGVPPDTISANGNRGQYVIIVPSRDIVIVRRGEDPAGARFDPVAFTRDVLAALE